MIPYGPVEQVLRCPPSARGLKLEAWTPVLRWHAFQDNYGVLFSKGHLSHLLRLLNLAEFFQPALRPLL